MTAWLSNRVWIIAAVLATVIGSYLALMVNRYAQIGGDGPNFWGAVGLVTQLPGAVVGEKLFGVRSNMVRVLGAGWGVIECFVVFWIGLLALPKTRAHDGEPGAAPSGGPAAPPARSGATGGSPSVS